MPKDLSQARTDRQAFLSDLERRARLRLASREVESLVADAREHLEESIKARLELGDAPAVAQREAIAAFGCPKNLIQAANAVHRARFQSLFLGCSAVSGLAWAFAILASPVLGSWAVIVTGLTFFAFLGMCVEASKVRRPLAPVLVVTAAFWLAFTPLCAWWGRNGGTGTWTAPTDLVHAALESSGAAAAFLAYLLLAYRMARAARPRRDHV